MDDITGEKGKLLSHNMFAYGKNNPVNNDDPDGKNATWISNHRLTLLMAATLAYYTIIHSPTYYFSSRWWENDRKVDKTYDNSRKEGKGTDKKRERKQIKDKFGRTRVEREKASHRLHKEKKGGRNDNNKSWRDLDDFKD